MPYVIRRPRLGTRLGALVSALVFAAIALPAAAQAASPCPKAPVSKPFSVFGDKADYSLLQGGDFEGSTAGWSLGSAYTSYGNESYYVGGSGDDRSLRISPDGTAVSPAFCVGIEHPSFRFFARRVSGSWGVLTVKLRWTEKDGDTRETVVGALSGDSFTSWQPTGVLPLAVSLPLWQEDDSLNVRVVLDPENYGGAWRVDDVYIDPYAR
jgi:hypothetical protein